MEENKVALQKIQNALSQLPLKDKLEVIANYFLVLGVARMKSDDPGAPVPKEHEQIVSMILETRLSVGETIGTALASQGLHIMMWIDSLKEE